METFKRLKSYYLPYKKYFFISLFFLSFITIITVIYPIVLQLTIDEVFVNKRFNIIPYIATVFFGLMVIKGFSSFLHQYLGDLFGINAVYDLRDALYKKLQVLSFKYYDNAKTGDLMSRLTADVEGFRFFLSFGVAELIRIVLLVIFSFGVMFYYSIPLALVTMAAIPFLVIVVFRFEKLVHPAFQGIRKSIGRMNTRVQENITGMHTVKSLSREGFEIDRFSDSNDNYRQNYIDTSLIWARFFPLMELIGNIAAVSLLAYGGYLVVQGQISLGELVAFFSLVWYIMGPLTNLGFVVNQFSQAKASGERLIEILDAEEDIAESIDAIDVEIEGNVVFNDVSFSYGVDGDAALKHINFVAEKGKTIGLIGATGAGKTSLTQLISRFYEPQSGEILIDDRPIKEYQLKTLRKHIGFVLQESFLFSTTIRENIAYGLPNITDEQVIAAAKHAQADDFIMKMPDGYNTMLGERGMGLSGGQKQRIAIARAICINPSILILDDATSAVDMETEFNIQLALKDVMKDRTSFIISHRISSLQHADEILVLRDGEITERGSHNELLKRQGAYKDIYDMQYKDADLIMDEGEGT